MKDGESDLLWMVLLRWRSEQLLLEVQKVVHLALRLTAAPPIKLTSPTSLAFGEQTQRVEPIMSKYVNH